MQNPWKQTVEEAGRSCLGRLLTFTEGVFFLDKVKVETGRSGLLLTVIMPRCRHSGVAWVNNKPTGLQLVYYNDCPPPREYPPGIKPYTEFLCVGDDEEHRGQMATFSNSSWGARTAFAGLAAEYLELKMTQYPVCMLGARPRNDAWGNSDPTFTPIGWRPRSDFPNLADVVDPDWAALPEPLPRLVAPRKDELVDDEIPF